MIAVGISKPQKNNTGSGAGNTTSFGSFMLQAKGVNDCVPNTGAGLEVGDIVSGWKDLNTYWQSAQYNGGNPNDRANYTPLIEIDMETSCTIAGGGQTGLPTQPHYNATHYDSTHYST